MGQLLAGARGRGGVGAGAPGVCVLHAGRPAPGRRGAGRRPTPSRWLATGDVRRPCPKNHMKIC